MRVCKEENLLPFNAAQGDPGSGVWGGLLVQQEEDGLVHVYPWGQLPKHPELLSVEVWKQRPDCLQNWTGPQRPTGPSWPRTQQFCVNTAAKARAVISEPPTPLPLHPPVWKGLDTA